MGSLCTGILGAELALEMMGLEPDLRWYSEIDRDACKVVAQHRPNVSNLGNLKDVMWERVEPVDVLVAGYPCQTESHAGKRLGANDPRWIWPWIACSVRVLRPRITLLENVAAHLSLGFRRVLGDLTSSGFDVRWTTLRAANVGACHGRDRLFIAAYPSGNEPERWGGVGDLGSTKREREREKHNNGNGFGTPLAIAVQLLPTPTHRDYKDEGPNVNWEKVAGKSRLGG